MVFQAEDKKVTVNVLTPPPPLEVQVVPGEVEPVTAHYLLGAWAQAGGGEQNQSGFPSSETATLKLGQ